MSTLIEFTGPARLDRRTKRLVHRLAEDDVAIVDHADLDRVTAEELLETGVRVVVNVSESLSGRFPNPGPLLLVRGGVTLIDAPGAELFDEVADGEPLTVRGASVFRNGTCLARGRAREERELERALAEQRGRVTESLSEFAENTLQHLKAEGQPARRGDRLPAAADALPRPARARRRPRAGPQARPADRAAVHPRLQAGADRRRRRRGRADRGGLQAGRDRRRHGLGLRRRAAERAPSCSCTRTAATATPPARRGREALGVPYQVVPAMGISEDVALLLAYEKGAELIVAVGTHFNLIEFLERNRAGMSSTFLTRLRVGEILVDAKGVSRLVSRRVGLWPLVALGADRPRRDRGRRASPRPGVEHLIELIVLRVRDWLGLG